MSWEKYKISEFLENFRWQITNVYKDTPKLKFWWHIFKTLIGAIFYGHPLVFFVLIILLRSGEGFDFAYFVIYGLALSNFAKTLSNQIVNYKQIGELNKYINKLEQIGVTFNSYEIEDYVKDEMVIDRLRKSRPNALMSNAKLGHIFRMDPPPGVALSELKGFVISRSLGMLSPFKTQNKSYVFVPDVPSQSAVSKYKLYHELGHLTDGSFQRRHSVYHYKLVTIIFIAFFVLVAPIKFYWLLLFLLPYFYLTNIYTTEKDNEYIDELCCDIFAIDIFEDRAELTTLKRLVPKVAQERYEKLENLDILPKDLQGQTTTEVLKNFIDRKWLHPGSSMSLAYISRIPEEEWILASSLLVPIIAFLLPPLSLNHVCLLLFTLLIVLSALGLFFINDIQIKRLERKTNALKSMNYTT